MESHLSPRFKKWMKKCLSDEFSTAIDNHLNNDLEPYDAAQKIINSREMTELTGAIRSSFVEQIMEAPKIDKRQQNQSSTIADDSRPQTSLSYLSDFAGDDWSSTKAIMTTTNVDEIVQIIDQISSDKPDHVRLAGYESLLETELTNLPSNKSWDDLLKTLRRGVVDGKRSVFEASLSIHAKLLNCPQYSDAHANLLTCYEELCQTTRLFEALPTLLSGINFNVFLHEKLVRVMKLIIDHQEQVVKGTRTADKWAEETIDRFVTFICGHSITSVVQTKPLNQLQILSVIEPRASWFKKWMHSLVTRKMLCSAIVKSPALVNNALVCVKKGLENPPIGVSVGIRDEPPEAFVSGDSVETFTFLHCLNVLIRLCNCANGRSTLMEILTEDTFNVPDFLINLLNCLNLLASSEASNALYEAIRRALNELLKKRVVLYDARFYQVTLSPLLARSELRMRPHTLDILKHMLDTADGPNFLTSEYRMGSGSLHSGKSADNNYPVVTILTYASNVLRQPISVVCVEHVARLFEFIGRLFNVPEIFYVVEEIVRDLFFPSVTYVCSKLDKYYVENESKTQQLDKALKKMLLNIVHIPLGLQMLSNEPLVFEELIRGSIAPVRVSWSDYDIVSFISNAGYLQSGIDILLNLAPHVMSTFLIELSKILEDPCHFHDPWDHDDIKVFLHVLAIFSLNTNCFIAFMTQENNCNQEEVQECPTNLYEFFQYFTNSSLLYHQLGLLTLKTVLWNLDIYVYLMNLINFQERLLKYQESELLTREEVAAAATAEKSPNYVVDECGLLRHKILLNCYFARPKRSEYLVNAEDSKLFSTLPPPQDCAEDSSTWSAQNYNEIEDDDDDSSELAVWLRDGGPGLRDNNWVADTRKAFKASPAPIRNRVVLDLLEQMEQAIPTVEWVDRFKWDPELKCDSEYWHPEDKQAVQLVIHYGLTNKLLKQVDGVENNLLLFVQSTHDYVNFNKSARFEGFDWFLATVFLICEGDVDKSKSFVCRILHFPSAMFMWPALAQVIDDNNEQEASTRLLFAHLLEGIITLEFSSIKFALKRECGIDWWMICDRLLTQCFWGILPWSEVINYFVICILHPPDYILYFCASLLNHCQDDLMKSLVTNKFWPEEMNLEDYRCHSQINLMDHLGKRHGGKVLPSLTQRKLNFPDMINSPS